MPRASHLNGWRNDGEIVNTPSVSDLRLAVAESDLHEGSERTFGE